MKKLSENQKGFTLVEALLIILILVVIDAVGYMVYHDNHKNKTTAVSNTAKTSTAPKTANTASTPTQKYITISAWGVHVPYPGGDTLSVSSQTCIENGDDAGDTVDIGCQVTVTSQDLANSLGSCTAKVSGMVGYFYRLGASDNYSYTNGSGYIPVTEWVAQNSGQYTKIGSYYYAFDEIGEGSGISGAALAANDFGQNYTGCSAWQAEYTTVEQSVQGLASKFETVPN